MGMICVTCFGIIPTHLLYARNRYLFVEDNFQCFIAFRKMKASHQFWTANPHDADSSLCYLTVIIGTLINALNIVEQTYLSSNFILHLGLFTDNGDELCDQILCWTLYIGLQVL